MTTAWLDCGKQAEAISASTLRSSPSNTRGWPVRTEVAVMNSFTGPWRMAAQSTCRATMSFSGFRFSGLVW